MECMYITWQQQSRGKENCNHWTETTWLQSRNSSLELNRLPGVSSLEKVGAGYTFFGSGKPERNPRISGVGFAIRIFLARNLESFPTGVSDRLIVLRLRLSKQTFATVFMQRQWLSTMRLKTASMRTLRGISPTSRKDNLILVGDFNARVSLDHVMWPNVLGKHGTGKCNSNGELLLSRCAAHGLFFTNTAFQQADKYKTTWMQPRSKHWHLLHYVIVRQCGRRYVNIIHAMGGSGYLSDHLLVRITMKLQMAPATRRQRQEQAKKLNVKALSSSTKLEELKYELFSCPYVPANDEQDKGMERIL